MLANASQGTGYDHPVDRTDHQAASDFHERCLAHFLEIAPQLMGPLHQGHVQRMLEVRLPNDATIAV